MKAKIKDIKKDGKVVRASTVKFKFELCMGASELGVRRSIKVIASSRKSIVGTRPACK